MATPTTPPLPTTMPAPNYGQLQWGQSGTQPYPVPNRDYNQMIQDSLNFFTDPNSQLMQQAKQQGMEVAAERGGINSSIAAGAAQRASLTQAQGLAATAVNAKLNEDQAKLQDWVSSQGFSREMASIPYQNSMNMLNYIAQAGIQDPELYTPSVQSGYVNFFTQNMNNILQQYFGNPGGKP